MGIDMDNPMAGSGDSANLPGPVMRRFELRDHEWQPDAVEHVDPTLHA
jgi:hypothetical protein